MYFTFDSPYYLFFLLALPVLFLIYMISISKRGSRAIKFANVKAIERIKGVSLVSRNIVIMVLFVLLFVLLIFSVAGTTLHIKMDSPGFSHIVAIDNSKSMEAEDYSPDRLSMAKSAAVSFVESFPAGSRLGVVSFSGISRIEKKLTSDKQSLKSGIDSISVSETGGTNILMPIQTSTNLLVNEKAKSVIIISDGQVNVGNIEEAISYANKNDVIIHTIGIGSKEGGRVSEYFLSKIDEKSLKSLAYNTGGEYYFVKSKQDLEDSFSNISEFKKAKFPVPLSKYFIIASLVLVLVIWILINTRFRVIP